MEPIIGTIAESENRAVSASGVFARPATLSLSLLLLGGLRLSRPWVRVLPLQAVSKMMRSPWAGYSGETNA